MTIRVLSVFGTRPEAIKMAPVVKYLEQQSGIDSYVAVTAQHREMLDQVLILFDIRPDFDLDIMKSDQDLFDITTRILLGLREVYEQCQPDIVLVHGDTTTCLAASLAAFYLQIPIGHVEAGLRTGDMLAPFPEEANRSLVGQIARYHFAPTDLARKNLVKENINPKNIVVTGNTVIDALLEVKKLLSNSDSGQWAPALPVSIVNLIKNRSSKFILITGHRRENFGPGFESFCNALKIIAQRYPEWLLIYPVHLNPNVQGPVKLMLSDTPNIYLIAPQDYFPFVWLLDQCDLVITDSGGIQEEAPSLGKPVLVTRDVTERPEAIDAGTVRLVGTDTLKIVDNAIEVLTNQQVYSSMSNAHNPYGDGLAAARIVQTLLDRFDKV